MESFAVWYYLLVVLPLALEALAGPVLLKQQGLKIVVPALAVREILLRGGHVRAGRMLAFLSLCVVLAISAFLFGLSILWETWIDGKSVPGYPSIIVGMMTIGGVQLLMIGIVGEYIGKILSEIKARPVYFVAEHTVHTAMDQTKTQPKRAAAE